MRSSKSAVYLVPSLNGRFVQFRNDGDAPVNVVIEHVDTDPPGAGSASVAVQESNTGASSDWVDVAGTATTINPGLSATIVPASTKAFLAIRGSGNVKVLVHVEKQVNGSPIDLGGA